MAGKPSAVGTSERNGALAEPAEWSTLEWRDSTGRLTGTARVVLCPADERDHIVASHPELTWDWWRTFPETGMAVGRSGPIRV